MKYIITENQNKLLIESKASLWIKRRLDVKEMKYAIDDEIDRWPDPCRRYDNADVYVAVIIHDSVNSYMSEFEYPDEFTGINLYRIMEKYFNKIYGDYLRDVWNKTC